MNEATRILREIGEGNKQAGERLWPLVYDELRRLARGKMAQEAAGHTLTPTALVHEAYLRLIRPGEAERWENRGHFFAAAAEAMRRILVENARRKKRLRRGGDRQRVDIGGVDLSITAPVDELLQIDGDMNSCPPSWSPDGKLFAWSRDGATLELIDGRSGHTERSWPVKHLVANLVWKHDGTQLATLQRDQHLRVWDVDSPTMVHDAEIPSNKSPWQYMGWSHDESLFAIGAKEVVHVFDGNTWQLVDRLAAGTTVPFFHWAPHRNRFLFSAAPVNGETYPMISIWERGREPVPVAAWYRDAINISWSPDGKQLASIHRTDGSVSIYDTTNGKMTRTLEPGRASRGRWVAWDRQGKRLATASGDRSVRIWDLDSQSNEPMAELLGHQRQVRWVGWHPNDDAMLVSFSTDKSLRFWNLEEPVVELAHIIHAKTSIASLCWGPDGRRLAGATSQTAGQHSNVLVWNADTGEVLATPFPDTGGWSTAWNRENRLLCTQPDQWTVCIVDPDSDFDMKLEMEGDRPALPQEGVLNGAGVRWSPDGRWLAIATQREGAVVWDFAHRTYVRIPSERDPDDQWATGVAWHPKGQTIAVIYRGVKSDEVAVYRFDPHAITFQMVWRRRRPHIGFGHPSALAWSPDGQFLAMGDADSAIRLWDPETGDIISTHRGHTGGIDGIDWDPDGRRFASAGGEGTIRVWSRHAKQSLIVLRGHAGSVNDVKWNRDGFRLASAGSDHTVRIWDTRDAYVTWHTEKALAIFDERLATQPDDAASLKSRADILWHTGHWDQAAKDLDRWIAQRPPTESTRWYATGWWISGPYAETNLDAPEQILEMNTPPDPAGLSGETAAGQRHPWRYVAKSGLHYLDLSRDFDGDGISAFALARVYSSKQQQVRLLVRANDAVSVWLNAQRVYADPEGRLRNIVAPASEVTVTLSEGWNSLLLKVVNAPDTDGFEFALEIAKP